MNLKTTTLKMRELNEVKQQSLVTRQLQNQFPPNELKDFLDLLARLIAQKHHKAKAFTAMKNKGK